MHDERHGVPSASEMHRLFHCPPSRAMCAAVPEEEESDDAASGTRIHAVLAHEAEWDTLSHDEAVTAEMCQAQEEKIVLEWTPFSPAVRDGELVIREQRLGMTVLGNVIDVTASTKAKFIFTGKPDLIVIIGEFALVLDYKTGRADVEDAVDNAQLMSLAVLVSKRYGVSNVRVVIVAPWLGKPTVADYDSASLQAAETWLSNVLLKAETATPKQAVAGDWCKWCQAKIHCEAFKSQMLQAVELVSPASIAGLPGDEQRKVMFAKLMDVPAFKLATAYRGLSMITRFVDSVKSVAKERARTDPEFQEFFTLEEKQGKREITGNGQEVFNALAPHGVTAEDMMAAASYRIGDLQESVRVRSGEKSRSKNGRVTYRLTKDEAGEKLNNALGPLMSRKEPTWELVPTTNRIE